MIVAVSAIALAVAFLVLFFPKTYCLMLSDADQGVLFTARLESGDEFAVRFIHSVNQTPVTEFFTVDGGRIFLTALEFESFGAGMPTELKTGQTLISLPCGTMRIEGFDHDIGELIYIVGHTAHTLLLGGDEIPLNTLAGTGQTVRFAHKRVTFL